MIKKRNLTEILKEMFAMKQKIQVLYHVFLFQIASEKYVQLFLNSQRLLSNKINIFKSIHKNYV